jgi:hypothetical protein
LFTEGDAAAAARAVSVFPDGNRGSTTGFAACRSQIQAAPHSNGRSTIAIVVSEVGWARIAAIDGRRSEPQGITAFTQGARIPNRGRALFADMLGELGFTIDRRHLPSHPDRCRLYS